MVVKCSEYSKIGCKLVFTYNTYTFISMIMCRLCGQIISIVFVIVYYFFIDIRVEYQVVTSVHWPFIICWCKLNYIYQILIYWKKSFLWCVVFIICSAYKCQYHNLFLLWIMLLIDFSSSSALRHTPVFFYNNINFYGLLQSSVQYSYNTFQLYSYNINAQKEI